MKKVLLLGDSIRMGYDSIVKEMLEGEALVFYDDVDNGRYASYTYGQMKDLYEKFGPFDVVHFNNGYWDMNREENSEACEPLPVYLQDLKNIVEYVRSQGGIPVFASTVPIYDEGKSLDNTGTNCALNYKNEWVINYNMAARALMNELKVEYNDLYELMLKGDMYYKCYDFLHLTHEGYTICAKQIVDIIKKLM